MTDRVEFVLPFVPGSKHNRKAVHRTRDGGVRVRWQAAVMREQADVALMASRAVTAVGATQPWQPDHDVDLVIRHHVGSGEVEVSARDMGPPAETVDGRTGRRRDIQNLSELICDAMSGVVYTDDRQVSRIVIERVL